MNTATTSRADFIEQLRELLPSREARRIIEDVDGLLQDRMEAEQNERGATPEEAERIAVEALGTPEALARELISAPLVIDFATRRLFVRLLAVTFAVHLLLVIILTAAGGTGPALSGLLGPLSTGSLGSIFTGVLSIALIDTGALFLIFALIGRGKAPSGLPALRLRTATSRRDAALGLVLLVLIALILHPFRNEVFALRSGDKLVGFLAPDLVAVLPVFDVALVLFAIRQIVILVGWGEHPLGVLADAFASLALAVGLVLAATRPDTIRFPDGALAPATAKTLEDLVTRVFLLVFIGAALFLVVRFVKRLLRLRQLIG